MDRRSADTPDIDWAKYPIPRVRHHVNSQAYFPASQHHVLPNWYPPERNQADWSDWFTNGGQAQVLDIGCGRGAFLLHHAMAFPDQNILGLEVRQMLAAYINTVAQGESLGNAHAEWYSVANGLDWIASGSIQYVTYLFADPWPKKRHWKRRAFSVELLTDLHRVLVPGGRIWLATDREDVDQHQRSVLAESGLFDVVDGSEWPFHFSTDQQMFCDTKGIPYVRYHARRIG